MASLSRRDGIVRYHEVGREPTSQACKHRRKQEQEQKPEMEQEREWKRGPEPEPELEPELELEPKHAMNPGVDHVWISDSD